MFGGERHYPVEFAPAGASLRMLFGLEQVDEDIYRAPAGHKTVRALFGGQVAAQALLAAGRTVSDERLPHSLHAYFLRPGRGDQPIILTVDRDRDGRGYSARRVTARQEGRVILNLSCSFAAARDHRPDDPDMDNQAATMPVAAAPVPGTRAPFVVDCEVSPTPQDPPTYGQPTRFWLRCVADLPRTPAMDAAVVTYLSDLSSGLYRIPGSGGRLQTTLDHSLWLHRPVPLDSWLLIDLEPLSTSAERGVYAGSVWTRDGTLVATLAQETLYRLDRAPGQESS